MCRSHSAIFSVLLKKKRLHVCASAYSNARALSLSVCCDFLLLHFDLVSVCFGVLFQCFVVFVSIVSSGCFLEEGNTSVEMSEDLGNRPGMPLLFSIFLL
jgi:hypothetical protein